MFPPFSGFEDISFCVRVEHQKRKRFVRVRIEQLPTSPSLGVAVFSFLDAPEQGEWLVGTARGKVHTITKPRNLLGRVKVLRVATRREEKQAAFTPHAVQRLKAILERALNQQTRVLRVVELADLPRPRVAFLSPSQGIWCNEWTAKNDAFFDAPAFDLDTPSDDMQQWLHHQWNDVNSEVRFAWKWATWNEEERLDQCLGFEYGPSQLTQILRWLLAASPVLYDLCLTTHWNLRWHTPHYESFRIFGGSVPLWQQFIWRYFFARWRKDWIEQHPCVRVYWEYRPIFQPVTRQQSTMHEQLEARLELRSWLQEKATPDEIEALMAQL